MKMVREQLAGRLRVQYRSLSTDRRGVKMVVARCRKVPLADFSPTLGVGVEE